MSNEKPVRITVGDVKEVTEATTIQPESSKEVFAQAAQTPVMTSPVARTAPNMGIILIGLVVGVLLLLFAAKVAFSPDYAKSEPLKNAPVSNSASSTPSGANSTPTAANNAPAEAANGTTANNNAPADANNASTSASTPAGDANAAANAPVAANNAPK